MLEDVLQPARLYWLVHQEAAGASPQTLRAIATDIAACVSGHTATSAPYLREVMRVYAGVRLREQGVTLEQVGLDKYELGDTFFVGLASPEMSAETETRVLCELAHASAPRHDVQRLLIYQLLVAAYVALPRAALHVAAACAVQRARTTLQRMVQRYAPECTFKTRGDLNVHSELLINHLPAWVSASMVENEMPYPLVAKVLAGRGNVNKVVRPLLDRAITDSVAAVDFDADAFHVSQYITIVCLIFELLSSRGVDLLVNGGVTKRTADRQPLPYLWRGDTGVLEHGVRHNGKLHVFAADVPAVDACLQWLWMSRSEGVVCTKHLTDLIFAPDQAEERNPFKKFLF